MNHDAVRSPVRANVKLTSSEIPFSDLPHQSRLFLDYLKDPQSLKRFYPNAVMSASDVGRNIPAVLAAYSTERDRLCNALVGINSALGAPAETLQNIDRLRQGQTVAVVTGQQAGLFTGPLYTVYKALTAIKIAEHLNANGSPSVPVFWAATEDHDFAEVVGTYVTAAGGNLSEALYAPASPHNGSAVGEIVLEASIGPLIDRMFSELPHSEFTDEVRGWVHDAWHEGAGYGEAFEKQILGLLGSFGLIVIDPLHPAVKELAAPIYAEAVEHADDIVAAIRQRSVELVEDGYHAQVAVDNDYFPLFWHSDDGRRLSLRRTGDGVYRTKEGSHEFTRSELTDIARQQPGRLSPGVMLRPVVQDHLFPTICYVGGAAEIAYFAQNAEAYRILGRPVTTIVHRQSVTVIESKQRRTLERFGLQLRDLMDGVDASLYKVGKSTISQTAEKHFDDAAAEINDWLDTLRDDLNSIDPTLTANLDKRRRKISYHIEALRKKAYSANIKKDETAERQIREAVNALVPTGQLQERVLNVNTFLNKHGAYFIDWLYREMDIDQTAHTILFI